MKRDTSIPLTVIIPIKDRNGTTVGEKEVASYAGLLSKAHDEGLRSIETETKQAPPEAELVSTKISGSRMSLQVPP